VDVSIQVFFCDFYHDKISQTAFYLFHEITELLLEGSTGPRFLFRYLSSRLNVCTI